MRLEWFHANLHWPSPDRVLDPQGPGPRVIARQAREKIGNALAKTDGGSEVVCGLLTPNPDSVATEAPGAIVCEFPRRVPEETLREAQRLAWNFSKSPTLITIEPQMVRSWSCCEPPKGADGDWNPAAELKSLRLDLSTAPSPSDQAAQSLEWVRFISGEHLRRHPERFRRDGRADRTLLAQLKFIRERLKHQKLKDGSVLDLDDDTIHDLIARVVFIQFLWDRKDSSGNAALNPSFLLDLQENGVLKKVHADFRSVLADYNDAYSLFRWLNSRFNGDLFPGKGETEQEREADWKREMDKVKTGHLAELAGLVSGNMEGKQGYLWRLYSFDVIPLEFISSVYEQFVKARGAHYTPSVLADFVLDGSLPWDGVGWDLKVLDPSCGSGVFLVKAYQRLIERWRNAHPGSKPSVKVLRELLERNLFGVDKDPHAVRVASFSLYLTMCDQIDPKHYLGQVHFPPLRGRRLVEADFFQENRTGFRTEEDAASYDVVVGNAPWGRDLVSPEARAWAARHEWPILNTDIGTLFLPKALMLTKPGGVVSMIQPAGGLLFNTTGSAKHFRRKLFTAYRVEEIINLSALRFELFERKARSPACAIVLRPEPPNGDPFPYTCPKPVGAAEPRIHEQRSVYRLEINSTDVNLITSEEAAHDPLIWIALFWGGRRDLSLIRKLQRFTSLSKLERAGRVATRRGATRGVKNRESQEEIVGLRIVKHDDDIDTSFIRLDAKKLGINDDPFICDRESTSLDAFKLPQLITKLSWELKKARFKAVIVESDAETGPVFCERSYFSVHAADQDESLLEAIWLGLNSCLAVYFLLLTSGRFASWVPEPNKAEFMAVPIPKARDGLLLGLNRFEDVDERVLESAGLKDSEAVLVRDLYAYTLTDFKGGEDSAGRLPTHRSRAGKEGDPRELLLSEYCEYFARVLKAGFGADKGVGATIFNDRLGSPLPVRLVAIHLDCPEDFGFRVEEIDSDGLIDRLSELNRKLLQSKQGGDGIFSSGVARVYDTYKFDGSKFPTVYLVKPDRVRFWTRSAALRDADEVSADLSVWSGARSFTQGN